jgi:hypothetical protein
VLVNKISLGEEILKYAYNMDLKAEINDIYGNLS